MDSRFGGTNSLESFAKWGKVGYTPNYGKLGVEGGGDMRNLVGEFRHKIDAKGRLSLPSDFRKEVQYWCN